MEKHFEGKNVYITGGSSGIGLSAAKQLAALGANILIFARTKERLEAAAADIGKHCLSEAQRVSALQIDVGDNENVNTVMSRAVLEFGPPDLLINCAGRAYPHYFEKIGYEQFDQTMKTNLYGIWNTTAALVPEMKKRGGCIVNVSSIAGFIGIFGYTAYCASKFGVIGFSEALRSELRSYGIRVAVLCPPDTDTPGFAAENKTKPEETKEASKGAKLMPPDEVARQLIIGIKRGRHIIIPGLDGKITWRIKRFFPALVDAVLNSQIKKVQKRLKGTHMEARP
ncbi:MAG TPA: SDR family oxidoreductase [Bacillota bacterium]|jgi:3-dehydrosphinganine reductase|nr:SDR family oxidoreductase [Bacillota bacterium]HOA36020.1 SDR family oxidoreductase [Bacillota bacterium]HOJ84508.1 SDR family oxidoreductase [Bacillota bacterium]HOL15195.1 SDR family oxidoreductase [Bacillota bacterium]HPZ12121.1 SDR family oxidoreductase [Bacillota bacterium]